MKKLVLLFAVFAAACGVITKKPPANTAANEPANTTATMAADTPGKMYVKWTEGANKTRSKDITIKQGLVRMGTEGPDAAKKNKLVIYDLILANYTFDPTNLPGAMPKQYGDTLIVVQVVGNKDAKQDGPPAVGTYPAGSSADPANVAGKVWNIMIRYSDDGLKDGKIMADGPKGPRQGQLKITSVADGKMTGEIEIFDDAGKVKGSFVADMPKK